jgi:hypothetical protein
VFDAMQGFRFPDDPFSSLPAQPPESGIAFSASVGPANAPPPPALDATGHSHFAATIHPLWLTFVAAQC